MIREREPNALSVSPVPTDRESGSSSVPTRPQSRSMETNELLDGEALTGKHAAIVFALWLGFVVVGALLLTFVV